MPGVAAALQMTRRATASPIAATEEEEVAPPVEEPAPPHEAAPALQRSSTQHVATLEEEPALHKKVVPVLQRSATEEVAPPKVVLPQSATEAAPPEITATLQRSATEEFAPLPAPEITATLQRSATKVAPPEITAPAPPEEEQPAAPAPPEEEQPAPPKAAAEARATQNRRDTTNPYLDPTSLGLHGCNGNKQMKLCVSVSRVAPYSTIRKFDTNSTFQITVNVEVGYRGRPPRPVTSRPRATCSWSPRLQRKTSK